MVSVRKKKLLSYVILGLPLLLLPLSIVSAAAASPEETAAGAGGMKFIGAAVAILGSTIAAGIALYGVAIGGSALLAENPNAFTQVLILGGLAEGVAVYGLLVAFLILGG